MFEFAISHNQRRRPSKLIIFAEIASCLIHVLGLIVLEKNPQLLRSGITHHFPTLSFFYRTPQKNIEKDRIITILRPMDIPSAAVLRKYMDELNKRREGTLPVVRVPLKDSFKVATNKKAPQAPKPPEIKLPDISAPANDLPLPLTASNSGTQNPEAKQSSGSPPQTLPQAGSSKKDSMSLPPPVKQESIDKTPVVTANSTTPPIETSQNQSLSTGLKVFSNKEQALKNSSDSGLFDTQGYPREKLDQYVSRIISHIKARWFIPSNLKNFQGHTTVVFFIDRNGGFYDIRTVAGSGNKKLDITALNAIIDSDPVDPLPKDFPGDHLGAKFVFSYNEPD
jgi:hypothetical protein